MKSRVFVPALASGVLLWAAFFPLDLGPLGFVALVPWLALVRAETSPRRRYLAAYLGGVVFFTLATNWLRVAHPMMVWSWVGISVVMPVFGLAALWIIRRLDRLGLPMALSVPIGWVALEYFRMHFPTGFPFMKHVGMYQMIGFGWYYLGYTQHAFLPLIQIADVGGVYAVSFVVAAVNGAVAGMIWKRPLPPAPSPKKGGGEKSAEDSETLSARGWFSPPPFLGEGAGGRGLVFALALLLASVGYGAYRLRHAPFAEGPVVAAIQGNIGQDDKMSDATGLLQSYSSLHLKAIRYDAQKRQFDAPSPDLVVWPETCCPTDWCDLAPGVRAADAPDGYQRKRAFSRGEFLEREWGTTVLFGLNGLEWDGERLWKYNSAVLIAPAPKPDPQVALPSDPVLYRSAFAGRYDKMHLVPFGEYVPLGEWIPFLRRLTPYEKGYECKPGETWTRFPLAARDGRKFTFACLICYEDSDPYLARQYVAREPVDFLVNISNDGWFKGTEEHEQHLAICRFRAVETRRAVVRSVNMGISGFIDPDGRVAHLPNPDWSKSKKVDAVVTATVPVDARSPVYAGLGDWVPAGCWLAALVGVVVGRVRRQVV